MEKSVTVRVGRPDDFGRLKELLVCMHSETGLAGLCDDECDPPIRRALARDRAIAGLIEEDGRLAASVGLFVGRFWYSRDEHIEDLWNYVHPDFRRRPMARPLIEFSKSAADGLDLPLLMGVLSDVRTEAKARLYARQLPQVGALYLYKPHGGAATEMKRV